MPKSRYQLVDPLKAEDKGKVQFIDDDNRYQLVDPILEEQPKKKNPFQAAYSETVERLSRTWNGLVLKGAESKPSIWSQLNPVSREMQASTRSDIRGKALEEDKRKRREMGLPVRSPLEYLFPSDEFKATINKYETEAIKKQAQIDKLKHQQVMKSIQDSFQRSEETMQGRSGIEQFGIGITSGMADLGAGMLASWFAKSPAPLLIQQGLSSYGHKYAQARAMGKNPKKAATAATTSAIIDIGTSYVPGKALVKDAAGSVMKQIGKQVALEAGWGFASGVAKSEADNLILDMENNIIMDGLSEAATNVITAVPIKGLEALKLHTKPVKETPAVNHLAEDILGENIPVDTPRDLTESELFLVAKGAKEVPNYDNPNSLHFEAVLPEDSPDNLLLGSLGKADDVHQARIKATLDNNLKMISDAEVAAASNTAARKVSQTYTNTLDEKVFEGKTKQILPNLEDTYEVKTRRETATGDLKAQLEQAIQSGDLTQIESISRKIKEHGTTTAQELSAFNEFHKGDPKMVFVEAMKVVDDYNKVLAEKINQEHKADPDYDINKTIDQEVKAAKVVMDEVLNDSVDQVFKGDLEKEVIKELKRNINGLDLPPTSSKKIQPAKVNLKEVIKKYYKGGKEDLETVKAKVREHFEEYNLSDDEINKVVNVIDREVHKGLRKQREVIKQRLLPRTKEQATVEKELQSMTELINSGALFDDKVFNEMLGRRLPKNIQRVLDLLEVDLKKYTKGNGLDKETLISDLQKLYAKTTNYQPELSPEIVSGEIEKYVNKTVLDFEIKERKAIIKKAKVINSQFLNCLDDALERGGILTDEELSNFVKTKHGQMILTQRDKEILGLKQQKALEYEAGSLERRSVMYDIQKMLNKKRYAAVSVGRRIANMLVFTASANVLSSPKTLIKNLFSNTFRGGWEINSTYITGAVSTIFKRPSGIREANIYTKAYFEGLASFNALIDKKVWDTIKLTSDQPQGNFLDWLHQLSYNKDKYMDLHLNNIGTNPSEIINNYVNHLGSDLWSSEACLTTAGKICDVLGSSARLSFDALTLADYTFKKAALEAHLRKEVYQEAHKTGITDSAKLQEVADGIYKDVKDYMAGKYEIKHDRDITPILAERAVQHADELTFQTPLPDNVYSKFFTHPLTRLIGNLFVRTPWNLLRFGAKELSNPITGLAKLKQAYDVKLQSGNPTEMIDACSRIVRGTILNAGMMLLLSKCNITGVFGKDEQAKEEAGLQQYTMYLPNGQGIDLNMLEPFGKLLVVTHTFLKVKDYFADEDQAVTQQGLNFIWTVANDLFAGDLLKGYSAYIDPAFKHSENVILDIGRNKMDMWLPATSFFKTVFRQENKKTLVYDKDSDLGILDMALQEIQRIYTPWASKDKLSLFSGNKITNKTNILGVTMDETEIENPSVRWLAKSDLDLPQIPKKPLGVDLSAEEYYDFVEYVGKNYDIPATLDKVVTSELFGRLSLGMQKMYFKELVSNTYDYVATKYIMEKGMQERVKQAFLAQQPTDEEGIDWEDGNLFEGDEEE